MTTNQKTKLNVVFGAMTLGPKGALQSRVHDKETAGAIIDVFQKHGHKEIDTARYYSDGGSERMLAEIEYQKRGLLMATKYYPVYLMLAPESKDPYQHSTREGMSKGLGESLGFLQTNSVDLWYLHAPDRTIPFEETFKAVDELHKQGKFKRLGLSNFQSWEVAQVCELCRRNGWKQPDVYQGVYNALHRAVEPELFPCLRHYGIAFYNYNPLAGGWLTDRYHRDTESVEDGSRFDPNGWQGRAYRARYWNEQYFAALDLLRPVAKKHGLTEAECALRWMQHHSAMKREFGDSVIIGASSVGHIEQNLLDFEKGPLPDDVVEALNQGWEGCKAVSNKYWH